MRNFLCQHTFLPVSDFCSCKSTYAINIVFKQRKKTVMFDINYCDKDLKDLLDLFSTFYSGAGVHKRHATGNMQQASVNK